MKFKVDENLPSELSEDLNRAGHDSATVFEEGIAGVDDLRNLWLDLRLADPTMSASRNWWYL